MWALRKKEEKLSDEEKQVPERLFGHSPELKMAYDFCRELTDISEDDISKSEAERKIRKWKILVRTSSLKCFDGFLKTLEKWSDEITNYFINRRTSTINRPGHSMTMEYDEGDNAVKVTDYEGTVTDSTYDGLDRLTETTVSGEGGGTCLTPIIMRLTRRPI